jgi:hypothetical protein
MAYDYEPGDLIKAYRQGKVIDPNMDYPDSVRLVVVWDTDDGPVEQSMEISAAQFFGHSGGQGAPISGDYLISAIDRMRRMGPKSSTGSEE